MKIVNNSDESFTFGEDLKVHSNGSSISILEPALIQKQFKQSVPGYLLYFLLTPLTLETPDSSTPIGLVIGPGLALGNMAIAGSSNSNFLKELQRNYLMGRVIKPGETVFGLIGIYDIGYNPLTLE